MAKGKGTKINALIQEQVDPETGEIIRQTLTTEIVEGVKVLHVREKHRFNDGGKGFITVFQHTMKMISMHADLTKNELQLLVYLMGTTAIDNSVCVDLDVLTSDLKLKKSNVSAALKGLVTRNIVFRKDGYRYGTAPLPFELKLNYDQLNYNLGYNGKTKEHAKKSISHPEILSKPLPGEEQGTLFLD